MINQFHLGSQSHSTRLGTLHSSFGGRDSLGEDLQLFDSIYFPVKSSSHPLSIMNTLSGLKVLLGLGGLCKAYSSPLWSAVVHSFQCLILPFFPGFPDMSGCGTRLWKWGTCTLVHLPYSSFPNYILFYSLDDDSDLYSPRYSFSEDSK